MPSILKSTGVWTVIVISNIVSTNCDNSALSEDQTSAIPTEEYKVTILVDTDDTFLNEGLNRPYMVRENPVTGELVVTDVHNNCLYFFTLQGEFVRKIGRKGQGPGDLGRPYGMDIDKDGNIYVYEGSNYRLSIFSKEGEFHESFRVRDSWTNNFFVTDSKEIVMNLPMSGYFITVLDWKGNILRQVGEIPYTIESLGPSAYRFYFSGFPFFVDESFYIFLPNLDEVRIYNKNGEFIRTELLSTILDDTSWNVRLQPPDSYVYGQRTKGLFLIQHMVFRNNRFYIKSLSAHGFDVSEFITPLMDSRNSVFYVLNKSLKPVKKIIPQERVPYFNANPAGFYVSEDGDRIYVTVPVIPQLVLLEQIK